MKKSKTSFRRDIGMLLQDIKSRRKNGIFVSILTIVLFLYFMYAETILTHSFNWIFTLLGLAALGLIVYIIHNDSIRNLHYSKQACYSVIIVGSAWVSSLIYYIFAKKPLIQATQKSIDGHTIEATLYMSPFFILSIVAICVLCAGLIAYAVGKRRKDIKGIKKEDLFR